MDVDQVVLMVAAVVFALVTGANDGGSLLAMGLPVTGLRVGTAMAILVTLVVAVPPLLGTTVATTFTERLVGFEEGDARILMSIAVIASMLVVVALTWIGLPTSLTLAVIGGVVGVGLGSHTGVEWPMVTRVLLIGAAAPVVGALAAYLVSALYRVAPPHRMMAGTMILLHRVAFTLQCVAYSLNDAQKMLAMLAVAFGATGASGVAPEPALLAIMGAGFALGTILGLPRVGPKLSNGLYAVRGTHTVAAELASGGAVLASAAAGAPVSMTQSVTGALLGVGVGTGPARVRWPVVVRMAGAWVITLPVSAGLAWAACVVVEGVRR